MAPAPPRGSTLTASKDVSEWFGRLMLEAAEAAGAKVSEARIRIYAADLADLPPEQLVAAVRRVRREGSGFFPSVAEIRRQCEASPDDAALLAWTALEQAAATVGGYRSVELEDTVAAAALVQVFGSWPEWCAFERGPELLTRRQQFLAAYRSLRRQAPRAEAARLPGLSEGGGDYQPRAELTMGHVAADGSVSVVREAPALAPRREDRLLTGDIGTGGQHGEEG